MTRQLLISIGLVLVTRSHYYKSIYRNSFKRCSKFRLHSRSGLRFLQNDLQPGPRKILILVFCEPSAQEQVRNYLAPGCSNTQPLIPTVFSALTVIHKCSTGADIFLIICEPTSLLNSFTYMLICCTPLTTYFLDLLLYTLILSSTSLHPNSLVYSYTCLFRFTYPKILLHISCLFDLQTPNSLISTRHPPSPDDSTPTF